MTNHTEHISKIKDGYKESKLGIIPINWEIQRIGNLARVKHGRDQKKVEDVNGKFPILGTGGVIGFTNEFLYDKPSVMIGRKGTIDKPRFMDTPFWTVDTLFYTEVNKDVVPKWLFYNFQIINWYLYNEASGVPSLSASNVSAIKIRVPKINEQKAIAKCLNTWDTAINSLTNLIDEKERQKKALMQQLLTGKKRLKGFNDEWKEKRIEEIAQEYSTKNHKNENIEVLSCTKYDGLVPSLKYFGRKVYGDDLSKYKVVPKNYFAYATNHIEEGSIGYQDFNEKGLVSPMYTVFKTHSNVYDNFFFRVLKSHKLIHEYNRRMEGSIDRRGGLRWKNFRRIKNESRK